MKIENPTYDKMLPFLGRHIEIPDKWTDAENETVTGRLACIAESDSSRTFYIGIETRFDRLPSRATPESQQHCFAKWKAIGPTDISVQWSSNAKYVIILGVK